MIKKRFHQIMSLGLVLLFAQVVIVPAEGWSSGLIAFLLLDAVIGNYVERSNATFRKDKRVLFVTVSCSMLLFFTSINSYVPAVLLFVVAMFYGATARAAARDAREKERVRAQNRAAEHDAKRHEAQQLAKWRAKGAERAIKRGQNSGTNRDQPGAVNRPSNFNKVTNRNKSQSVRKNARDEDEVIDFFINTWCSAQSKNFVNLDGAEPNNSGHQLIMLGRSKLIDASLASTTDKPIDTRSKVEAANEVFRTALVSVGPEEFGRNIREGQANALLWIGISDAILGLPALALAEEQYFGPGKAFMQSIYLFNSVSEFSLAGRAAQEWGESMLYAANTTDAQVLFILSAAFLQKANQESRALIAINRSENLRPIQVDSQFLLSEQPSRDSQVTTVLGCKNTTQLREICVASQNAAWVIKKFGNDASS